MAGFGDHDLGEVPEATPATLDAVEDQQGLAPGPDRASSATASGLR